MSIKLNNSNLNIIPDEYKIFTYHKPDINNIGPIGISYEISPKYPLIRKYERLITHQFVCTCCNKYAYLNLVKQFLEEYPVNHPIIDGNTLLHYAFFYDDKPSIEYLLSIGADKYIKNNDGLTPTEIK